MVGGLLKYGPLTAFIFLITFGVVLAALMRADKTPQRTHVELSRVTASPSQQGGTAQRLGDRMNTAAREYVAATNSAAQPPSAPPATASPPAPQRIKAQASVRQLESAQRLSASQPSPASSFKPQQDVVAAATASPPETQRLLPPGVDYASERDPVRILSINLSSDTVQAGDVASARVITTSNAAALTARIGSYQVNVPRVAPGTFALSMNVPHIYVPGHRVVIVVTAIRSDGASTQRSVPLDVFY